MFADSPTFEPGQLEAMASVSVDAVGRIAEVFIATGSDRIVLLQQALTEGDRTAMHEVGHSLKGSCGSVGAIRLADMARFIENHARDVGGSLPPEYDGLAEQIGQEFDAACAEVQRFIERLKA